METRAAVSRIRNPVAAPASEERMAGGSAARSLGRPVSVWAAASVVCRAVCPFHIVAVSAGQQISSAFRNGAARATGQKRRSARWGTLLVRRSYAANPAVQAKTSRL